jgi:hypothetical protein
MALGIVLGLGVVAGFLALVFNLVKPKLEPEPQALPPGYAEVLAALRYKRLDHDTFTCHRPEMQTVFYSQPDDTEDNPAHELWVHERDREREGFTVQALEVRAWDEGKDPLFISASREFALEKGTVPGFTPPNSRSRAA